MSRVCRAACPWPRCLPSLLRSCPSKEYHLQPFHLLSHPPIAFLTPQPHGTSACFSRRATSHKPYTHKRRPNAKKKKLQEGAENLLETPTFASRAELRRRGRLAAAAASSARDIDPSEEAAPVHVPGRRRNEDAEGAEEEEEGQTRPRPSLSPPSAPQVPPPRPLLLFAPPTTSPATPPWSSRLGHALALAPLSRSLSTSAPSLYLHPSSPPPLHLLLLPRLLPSLTPRLKRSPCLLRFLLSGIDAASVAAFPSPCNLSLAAAGNCRKLRWRVVERVASQASPRQPWSLNGFRRGQQRGYASREAS